MNPIRLAHKEKDGNVVTIDCTKVTAAYHGFNAVPGSPNYVVEWITIKNPPESISKVPIVFPAADVPVRRHRRNGRRARSPFPSATT